MTNGTVDCRGLGVCCAVSLAGFGRHLDVEPAHSAGVQAEGRTAVAASSAVDDATSSHNCKRVVSRCRASLRRSIALPLQALQLVRRSRGRASN